MPKMTFVFPYHFASYLKMTHTQTPLGNQSERDTSCLDSHISDKPDLKALFCTVKKIGVSCEAGEDCSNCWTELQQKGYTQIEGQSTQGSDM